MARLTPDITDFLARLVRLDQGALVRVRGERLWSRVPWGVLVVRTVAGSDLALTDDLTVAAADWLAADLAGLPRRDADWRAPLPNATLVAVETLPTSVIRGLSVAAADTLRATVSGGLNGRAVGHRALRDALLDHVAITITAEPGDDSIEVPQRLVQAMARMGFLGADDEPLRVVRNGLAGGWVGLDTAGGTAWWRRPTSLAVRPLR